jgi:hypothetical protein
MLYAKSLDLFVYIRNKLNATNIAPATQSTVVEISSLLLVVDKNSPILIQRSSAGENDIKQPNTKRVTFSPYVCLFFIISLWYHANQKLCAKICSMKHIKINNSGKAILTVLAVLASVYAILLLVPLTSAYAKYPIYFVKCGGQPIIGDELKIKYYYVPGSSLYRLYPTAERFFCTEKEALDAGYIKNY